MKRNCSCIILAGGRSSRMKGENKAFVQIGGMPLIRRAIDTLMPFFDRMLVVVKDASLYRIHDVTVVEDLLDVQSPLSGIHAGLARISTDHAFCVGCDMPFLKKGVVTMLLDAVEPWADVIVPYSGLYYQPLCAVYSKRCAPVIEAQLMRGDKKVDHLFDKIKIKTVSYDRFKSVDPDLVSFFNINAPADLALAERSIPDGTGST